jgi:hypothetical protein
VDEAFGALNMLRAMALVAAWPSIVDGHFLLSEFALFINHKRRLIIEL